MSNDTDTQYPKIFSAADLQAELPLVRWPSRSVTLARASIVKALEEADEPLTPKQIAGACSFKPVNVRQLLAKMLESGMVEKATYGKYTLPFHHLPALELLNLVEACSLLAGHSGP